MTANHEPEKNPIEGLEMREDSMMASYLKVSYFDRLQEEMHEIYQEYLEEGGTSTLEALMLEGVLAHRGMNSFEATIKQIEDIFQVWGQAAKILKGYEVDE
jgi:hypothetical protein